MNLTLTRTCFVISNNPVDHAVFTQALIDVSPQTLCFTIASGEDAFDLMRHELIIPTYIFMELEMPGMNGVEFLKKVKTNKHYKNINVIIHATSLGPQQIKKLRDIGAYAIYLRPYEYLNARNLLTIYFSVNMPPFQLN